MSVHLTKAPPAYDYDAQRWVTGPAAAILHLAHMPERRTALADPAYRQLVGLDTLGAWAAASVSLDTLEAACLAVLAPDVEADIDADDATWRDIYIAMGRAV